ncbi:uncharacterized protein LOC122402828 [Colletes gigas]|uniref:uncharacterized protein LOC122402828 n=1 Tax=Colletes gigas TaxID=935657 RepID=UPI001C9B3AA8|nr:uncharacterized protein LOC122402828 [Colletes gigas]
MNSCRLFGTEYSRNYIKRKLTPTESCIPTDYFAERIEEGEIDPLVASIPTKLDEDAEQLVYKHFLDYQRSVYQVSYKNHWTPRGKDETEKDKSEAETKGKDFESELMTYIQDLYHDPHEEKILAPPATTKRTILAAVCFHLHWVKRNESLERWHTRATLNNLNIVGFISAVAGITGLIWYLFLTFYYKIPLEPVSQSTGISAVWSMICGKWGILLMYYSHKYQSLIGEGSAPILTESSA